jgi:hypothetical protein
LLFFLFATTSLSGQSGSTSFNVNNETKGLLDVSDPKGWSIQVTHSGSTVTAVLSYAAATETITITPPAGPSTGKVRTLAGPGSDTYYSLDKPANFQVTMQGTYAGGGPPGPVTLEAPFAQEYCTLTKSGTCSMQDFVIATPAFRNETSGPNLLYLNVQLGDAHVNVYYDFAFAAVDDFIGFYNGPKGTLLRPDPSFPLYAANPDPDEIPTFYAVIGYQLANPSGGDGQAGVARQRGQSDRVLRPMLQDRQLLRADWHLRHLQRAGDGWRHRCGVHGPDTEGFWHQRLRVSRA